MKPDTQRAEDETAPKTLRTEDETAAERTRPESREWWCRLTLRVLAASFAFVGALFLFAPDATIGAMNAAGARLGAFTPAPVSALRFWLSLATGYMVLVTALAYGAQRDLHRHRDLLALLALGKATSSLTCLVFYLYSAATFIYLANFLVDGTIALTAVAIWAVVPSLGPPAVAAGHERTSGAAGGHTFATSGERRVGAGAERTPGAAPARTLRALAQHPAMGALLEAMVPGGGPFAAGGRDGEVAIALAAFVGGAGSPVPRALGLALWLLELSPFVLPPLRARRFSRLALDERVRLLEAWERSRLMPRRQVMHALKTLVMAHVYSQPEIEARLGYPHPLVRVPRPAAPS